VPGALTAGLRGARLGMVWAFGFLDDFVKREGRTMEAEVLRTGSGLSGVTAAGLVGCSRALVGRRDQNKS
jgi:hypothetical protein